MSLPAFKAYDIRGRVPDELNEDLARRIGVALAGQLESGPVVVGHDVRLASQGLQDALSAGLRASGREVIDIGLCGTEEVYFQTDHLQAAGGVMVTASHNPMDYNGMKLVRENARPISSDTGLFAIRDTVAADTAPAGTPTAAEHSRPDKSAYIAHLLSYIDIGSLKPLKLVVNAGNGGAGAIVDLLAPHLPFEFVRVFHEPDGHFPNGIPNPLLPENREATAKAVKQHGADFGIAWDGDFDRCFFFDENGRFIEGYYLVGLLAQAILAKQPGGKVVHDPRLTWNTIEMVEDAGGVPVLCKSGHAFIKEKMRSENAVYGGEMSAHHYFREFAYADSGMIPWLLIAELVSQSGRSLADLVEARMQKFPCSGEINFKVADAKAAVARVMQHYAAQSPALDHTDGVSAEFAQWRFNLRSSNTEPLLRLNVETRGDAALLEQRTQEISDLLRG
ncbi:phosphomannomutase/phosphoglucomutase [Xanthomonas translucens]|uniref:phosphomannomutase n=2 Tax=Xanthomonas campestris pv. translucens TaxID=343 RepID=A0A120EX27_XANCT|nr:phosphomannomutase/phosphoglucomutase [Xanthomonas translucens]KWV13819.1 phosphomannomutase [Xanthomonas translucens]QSQ31346.1 phosphomannomutase/phosphoglucomutase [Xanthomonas translucens pv. translucens]QSQ32836.1 phosphomannomutase/phosphoglucomutase [Xanthomonas translucens pv. translucens]UII64701.1 phosphomannomutase/phosphoglucomutase [Xanthomonas translucens]UNU10532.1 phosphomannomutase/phosphoglucomutase [Xanthomonas translucens pv. translucens]